MIQTLTPPGMPQPDPAPPDHEEGLPGGDDHKMVAHGSSGGERLEERVFSPGSASTSIPTPTPTSTSITPLAKPVSTPKSSSIILIDDADDYAEIPPLKSVVSLSLSLKEPPLKLIIDPEVPRGVLIKPSAPLVYDLLPPVPPGPFDPDEEPQQHPSSLPESSQEASPPSSEQPPALPPAPAAVPSPPPSAALASPPEVEKEESKAEGPTPSVAGPGPREPDLDPHLDPVKLEPILEPSAPLDATPIPIPPQSPAPILLDSSHLDATPLPDPLTPARAEDAAPFFQNPAPSMSSAIPTSSTPSTSSTSSTSSSSSSPPPLSHLGQVQESLLSSPPPSSSSPPAILPPANPTSSSQQPAPSIPLCTKFFFLHNYLDEPLEYGFYAIPREFAQLPTLQELRSIPVHQPPPFHSSLSHVFVLEATDERLLRLRQEALDRLSKVRSKRFHAKIKELLVLLKEHFPSIGPYAAQSEIAQLMRDHETLVVPIGALKKVTHEELAILFKFLCQALEIDCRAVRGKNPANKSFSWAFVREGPFARWMFVNVVEGSILPASSMEALEFVFEGTLASNGAPLEGAPFPQTLSSVTPALITTSAGLLAKPSRPLIVCSCHHYEEVSPMVACAQCRGLIHGACRGYFRQEDLPADLKCLPCLQNKSARPPPQSTIRLKLLVRQPSHPEPLASTSTSTSTSPPASFSAPPPSLTSPPSFSSSSALPTRRSLRGASPRSEEGASSPRASLGGDSSDSHSLPSSAQPSRSGSPHGPLDDLTLEEPHPHSRHPEETASRGPSGGEALPVTPTPTPRKAGRPRKDDPNKPDKPKIDQNAPIKPLSCYHIFCKEVREDLKKSRSDVSYPIIGQIAGDRWKKLSEEQKAVYVRRAQEQKEIYEHQMEEYRKSESFLNYQKYLEDFQAKFPRASIRKRSYSDVNVIVETSPSSSPVGNLSAREAIVQVECETPKRQRTTSQVTRRNSTPILEKKKEPPASSSPTSRRRKTSSSLFDLDDFIPGISTPTTVTPVKVKEVVVPFWQSIQEASFSQPNLELSEDEDTSDEAYQAKHSSFEFAERNRLPLPIKRRLEIHTKMEEERQARERLKGSRIERIRSHGSPQPLEAEPILNERQAAISEEVGERSQASSSEQLAAVSADMEICNQEESVLGGEKEGKGKGREAGGGEEEMLKID